VGDVRKRERNDKGGEEREGKRAGKWSHSVFDLPVFMSCCLSHSLYTLNQQVLATST
jgi:hypothetical protein